MSKKIKLTIPKPCYENWDGMTPVEKARPDDPFGRGKFCDSCQKQVIDFSNMSDRQVADFFKKPSTGSVCGRFMIDQLDRDMEIPKKRIPWVKYFFQIVIPAFLVSIKVSAQTTKGKIKVATVTSDTTRRADNEQTIERIARPVDRIPLAGNIIVVPYQQSTKGEISVVADTANKPKADTTCTRVTMGLIVIPPVEVDISPIKGRIINESGEPLPYATIMIKGTKIAVASNAKGEFSIKPATKNSEVVLVGSYVGRETKELLFKRNNQAGSVVLQLKSTFPLYLISCPPVQPVKNEVKEVKLMPSVLNSVPTSFKVFPNPVEAGSHLTIEWKQIGEGYFILQLLNQAGQLAHQREVWIDNEARILRIQVPALAAGGYSLVLRNKKSGKKFTEKIIIQ